MHASSSPPGSVGPHFPVDEHTSESGPRRRYDKVSISRLQFDSGEMTQVATPNPMLLAVARGEMLDPPRRLRWFAAGMAVGAVAVWFATSDVRADIYAGRVHVASILRSLRGQVGADDPPAARVTITSTGAAPSEASTHAASVPSIDVSQLPLARTPAASASPNRAAPNAPIATPAPGTPTLANAPGPR